MAVLVPHEYDLAVLRRDEGDGAHRRRVVGSDCLEVSRLIIDDTVVHDLFIDLACTRL